MVSDYISRVDAINAALAMDNLDCSMDVYLVRDMLKLVPAADVAEVIRCRDCKKQMDKCGEYLWCNELFVYTFSDDFCSRAERRETD